MFPVLIMAKILHQQSQLAERQKSHTAANTVIGEQINQVGSTSKPSRNDSSLQAPRDYRSRPGPAHPRIDSVQIGASMVVDLHAAAQALQVRLPIAILANNVAAYDVVDTATPAATRATVVEDTYGSGVTTSPSGLGIQLPSGSIVEGKALAAYTSAFNQDHNVGGAEEAALGSLLADKVTHLRQQIQTDPQLDHDGSIAKQLNVVTNLLLANDAYYAQGIPELLPMGVRRLQTDADLAPLHLRMRDLQPNDGSDFSASAYYDANRDHYVIADRGTTSKRGWLTDIKQALGIHTRQYDDAAAIALNVKNSSVGASGQVEYSGHSLGGGLASLQAIIGNTHADTFNSAGVNEGTAKRYGVTTHDARQTNAFSVAGDLLSTIQDHSHLPAANGRRIFLPAVKPVLLTRDGVKTTVLLSDAQKALHPRQLHSMMALASSVYTHFPALQSVSQSALT